MTIEQVLEVIDQRIQVLDGELGYYHPFSSQWEEYYGRQSELVGLTSLLAGLYDTNAYLNHAIEERVEDNEDE